MEEVTAMILPSIVLLGVRHGGVSHPLLGVALVEFKPVVGLLQGFADSDNTTVSEDTENALYKFNLFPVHLDVLII